MKLILELLSYTLPGSGEGSGLFDADILFDEYGLPYIPARRIKGILRESADEICEMLGLDNEKSEELIHELFGQRGFQQGKLSFMNLYIQNVEAIREELHSLMHDHRLQNLISSADILDEFTAVRTQTALVNGVAKKGSLRTVRVLKPCLKFEGIIHEREPLSQPARALFYLAVLNFRRIGTARTRGFGRVKATVDGISMTASEGFEILQNGLSKPPISYSSKPFVSTHVEKHRTDKNVRCLEYFIETLEPVILARPSGENNTVSTYRYIPAWTMRGVCASLFIRSHGLDLPHRDETFRRLFLQGNVRFTPAFPHIHDQTFVPPPLCLQKEKGSYESEDVWNVFENESNVPLKPLDVFISLPMENSLKSFVPNVLAYFHNQRDRLYGMSREDTGAIFYYESLDRGQTFHGWIQGPSELLHNLLEATGTEFFAHIGRSRSAQYGYVRMRLKPTDRLPGSQFVAESYNDTEVFVFVLTPVLMLNKMGMPDVSLDTLKEALSSRTGWNIQDFEIPSFLFKTEPFEHHVAIWNMKSPRFQALAPGSCFIIEWKKDFNNEWVSGLKRLATHGIGLYRETGCGLVLLTHPLPKKFRVEPYLLRNAPRPFQVNHTKDLVHSILQKKLFHRIRALALQHAKEFVRSHPSTLSTHLIGRISRMVQSAFSHDQWNQFFEKLHGKKAGKALEDAGLFGKMLQDDFIAGFAQEKNIVELLEISKKLSIPFDLKAFGHRRVYWYTFFHSLRVQQKIRSARNEHF